MRTRPPLSTLAVYVFMALAATVHAQVPQLINYQGRVSVNNTNFDGADQFRFALVNAAGGTTSGTEKPQS